MLISISYQAFLSVDFMVIYKEHPDCYPGLSNRRTEAQGLEVTWLRSSRPKSAPFSIPVSYQLSRPLSNTPQPQGDLTLFPSLAVLARV